jgi:hypothetical protein
MQTYLVHTRQPLRLLRELGWWRCLGLHVFMGGILLSVLVHPFCYLLLAVEIAGDRPFDVPLAEWQRWIWRIAMFNLAAGYLSSIAVALLAAARRGRSALGLRALFMPVYWLLISIAGYRALIQLIRAPYVWEKTAHGSARRQTVPQTIDWSRVARRSHHRRSPRVPRV